MTIKNLEDFVKRGGTVFIDAKSDEGYEVILTKADGSSVSACRSNLELSLDEAMNVSSGN